MPTKASALYEDKRISEAKKLIKEALSEHSQKIKGPKDSDNDLKKPYEELLSQFGSNRGGNLFYDYLGSGIGNGPLVELADGSVKYDFITGIGVHYFGHSNPELVDALIDAAIANTTMHGHLQQNTDSAKLVELIVSQAKKYGSFLRHCLLTSSGVMACENALKMCFQKKFPANRVLAFEKCFMGRTLAACQITDKAAYREGMPDTLQVDYIPFYDHKDHEGSIKKSVKKLEEHLSRHPCQYAVFCMELIQGEAGAWPGHEEFFKAIIDVCKKHNISILVDEVQTFMRTSELFAFQYFKLDQLVDVVTIGKNSQVCATIFTEEHKPRAGLISQTFTSSTSAIAAGYKIIHTVVNDNYLGEKGKIMMTHDYFKQKLVELNNKYPNLVEGPYGIGAMIGMTLFKGDMEKSKQFTFKLFQNGVTSFIAGKSPTRVRFLLPMGVIEHHHIDDVVQIIEKTLKEV